MTTSYIQERYHPREQSIIKSYAGKLMSGEAFRLCAASAKSIIGYQPPTGHREYAQALEILAKGAALSDRQATLISKVVPALTLHFTPGDAVGRMYEAASNALDDTYFDTILAASPEPGRHSDHTHDYTLEDRIIFMFTLGDAAAVYLPRAGRAGWCLDALRQENGVRVLPEPR